MGSLKFEYMQCPFCNTEMHRDSILEFSEKYIRCTNSKCSVGYIPRDRVTRNKLIELIETSSFLENSIFCAQCELEYIPACVPHNTKFSICPSCSFKNPNCEDTREAARVHFHGRDGHLPRCEDCKSFYDNWKYRVFDVMYSGDVTFKGEELFLCADCCFRRHYKDLIQQKQVGTGKPFKLPEIESYPEEELTSQLHTLSNSYLTTLLIEE